MSTFIAMVHRIRPNFLQPFLSHLLNVGFQRVVDLIWSAADSRARGFLIGELLVEPHSMVKAFNIKMVTLI